MEDVLNRAQRDPSYDIAKMLLSATCWFGAVQRGAFVIEKEDQGSSVWKLTADSAREPQASGNETRGVSGAKVLRLVAPIGSEAWGNHAKAAKVILQEYVELLTITAKDNHSIDINCVEFPPFRGRFTVWDSSRALRWLRVQCWTYPPLVVDG